MLLCGHSYCSNCIRDLYRPKQMIISCPYCFQVHSFTHPDALDSLVKNYTLLSLAQRTTTIAPLEQQPTITAVVVNNDLKEIDDGAFSEGECDLKSVADEMQEGEILHSIR